MTRIIESPDGYRWHVGGPETDDHLVLGGHEPGLVPIMRSLVDKDRGYVNVGAHAGLWAIRLAELARYVIAIEANPITAITLQLNVGLNDLQDKVKIVPQAAWDVDNAYVTLIDENDKASGGSTRVEEWGDLPSEHHVRTVTLDTLFDGAYETVGFISFDVEGAEARVLEGASKLLDLGRPNLLIELHDGHPGTDADLREQVYALLEAHNYSYTSIFVAPPGEHLLCYPSEVVLDDPEPA